MNDFSKEINVLIFLLKEVGEKILEIYNSDFTHEIKEDDSPLTKADLLSEKIIVETLQKEFPNDGIITEETPNDEDVYFKKRVWIVDPLDGTMDFIQKTGEFSIMVGLIEDGIPIIGGVYAPAIDKMYVAEKGKGSYLIVGDAKPVKLCVSDVEDVSNFKMVRSRNHFREEDKKLSFGLGITKFELMGSVGVKFGAIAEGRAEICAYTTSKMGIWDDCASHVILKEAGGDVYDVNGDEPVYDLKSRKMKHGFIGTNGYNKGKVLEAVKNARRE